MTYSVISTECHKGLIDRDLFFLDNEQQIIIGDGGYQLFSIKSGEILVILEKNINDSKRKLEELGKDKKHPVFMKL